MSSSFLSSVGSYNSLRDYLSQINVFPVLTQEEEAEIATKWVEEKDVKAAHSLVTSHLRLVVKIAMGFRGYGLPLMEMVSEGNIGLMHAVKKFDPEKGCRFATYAMWWVKSSIQEYILRSWSLVKIATTNAQKRLFFSLRKIQRVVRETLARDKIDDETQLVAEFANVSDKEVISMNNRLLQADCSLNNLVNESNAEQEWQDMLQDSRDNQEILCLEKQLNEQRRALLYDAIQILNERERMILMRRRLKDKPYTLKQLSEECGVSTERVRQIENKAIEKIKKYFALHAN